MGNETIEAHVWAFESPVQFDPEASLDELLIAVGRQNFLERTKLLELAPDHDIHFTAPGQYNELLAQIHDLQDKLSQIDGEPLPYEDAVMAWYEMVYLPAVEAIRRSGLLVDFPGRTEADLFVWLSSQYEALSGRYGVDQLDQLTLALAQERRPSFLTRLLRRLRQPTTND